MNRKTFALIASWLFALVLVIIGVLNLILVHPVPGIAYLIFSLIYIPPVMHWLKGNLGIRVPAVLKIVLGIFMMWFTLGVSDLADILHI